MPAVAAEILIILLLVLLNTLFAMSEIAIVSAWKARLQQWAGEGDRRPRAARQITNPGPDFIVQPGDVLYLWGIPERVEEAQDRLQGTGYRKKDESRQVFFSVLLSPVTCPLYPSVVVGRM